MVCAEMSRAGRRSAIVGTGQVVLLPPAAFAVHQLRYLLAYGGGVGPELQRTGHAYLHSVVPWLVGLVALAAGGFLRALGRACAGHSTPSRYAVSLVGLWLVCAAALIGIFAGQELLEGMLLAGHPAGWIGVFGYGGWWAVPVALIIGLVLAAVLHGALWVLHEVARRRGRIRAAWRGPVVASARPGDALVAPIPPLLSGWSTRGPPA
jgi:hypothetical protein